MVRQIGQEGIAFSIGIERQRFGLPRLQRHRDAQPLDGECVRLVAVVSDG